MTVPVDPPQPPHAYPTPPLPPPPSPVHTASPPPPGPPPPAPGHSAYPSAELPPTFDYGDLPKRPSPGADLPAMGGVTLLLVTAAGIAANLALRTSMSTASATIAAIITAIVLVRRQLLRDQPVPSQTTWVFAAASVVFALLLPLRASTWLASLNSLACIAALVGLALTGSGRSTRFTTSGLATLVRRLGSGFASPWLLGRSLRPARTGSLSRFVPVARGLLLAVVPVLVLGSLLASADAVFAAAISPDIDPSNSIGHAILTLLCVVAIASLVAIAETRIEDSTSATRPLGAVEALIVLGSLALLYAGFAAVQLFSALGRTDDILIEQGVSASDYARNGFFQLLWVAALTGLLLGIVRLLVAEGSASVTLARQWISTVVALLTCVIVAVAIVRLDLYTDAFGQTTLRWYSTAFAWMLGAAFALIAAAQLRQHARWLPTALVSLSAATLLVVNVLNAEARVAEHNLARADASTELDAMYLVRLSADAWPVLLENQDTIVSQISGDGLDRFRQACNQADKNRGFGPFGFNLAEARLAC